MSEPYFPVGFVYSTPNGDKYFIQTDTGPVELDGSALPKAMYPRLYEVLGATYGALVDDALFVLPDPRRWQCHVVQSDLKEANE